MRIGLMTLIAATVVSGTASLLMFTGVFILTCSFLIVTYPLLLVSLIDFKERYVRAQIAFSMILLFVAPFLAFSDYLRVFWVAMQFAGTFSLIAILAPMMIKPFRKRMALGITYAVAASLFPAIIPWGIPIGFGLLVACGALLAATAFTMQAREERDKEALAASILVAAFGAASYAHWIMFPGWEGWDVQAIVRIALITATLYAFAAFAKPVSAKIRSGVVSTLGVFLMAFGVFGATVPSSTAWPPDLGIYFIIFGGGALFIAMRMHKPAYVWSRVCLGVGLFIITMASISLVSRWPTLEMLWMAALGLWLVVGIAICTSQFLGHIADHVVAIRAGTIAAVGASVILAGVYMLMLGFGAEGAVELVLGVPLVGYAFIKSGAPWTSRMLMSVLFMTTVAVTWFAVIVNAF